MLTKELGASQSAYLVAQWTANNWVPSSTPASGWVTRNSIESYVISSILCWICAGNLTKRRLFDDRAFSFAVTKLWNTLPENVRNAVSLSTFKKNLKTHLFQKFYRSWMRYTWALLSSSLELALYKLLLLLTITYKYQLKCQPKWQLEFLLSPKVWSANCNYFSKPGP